MPRKVSAGVHAFQEEGRRRGQASPLLFGVAPDSKMAISVTAMGQRAPL
jgi:hypothetical protein